MRFVEVYLDHSKIGCGWRRYFVVKEGRLKARLFYPAECRSFDVPLDLVNHRKTKELWPATRREAAKIAAVVRDVYKMRKRLGLLVSGADAKEVMTELSRVKP